VARVADENVVELLKGLDPRKVGKDRFVSLLAELDQQAAAGGQVDLSDLDAATFARLITRASADQLQGVLARPELRVRVLDEIFRRMGEHLRSDRATHTSAVVHWRLTGGTGDGGYDRYETVIEHGTCVSHRDRTREPRVTITAHPADFLRLITRNASGPVLFMTGKVKINGDLGFAAGLTSLFDLPRG
jgi:putative sterol carrier protein